MHSISFIGNMNLICYKVILIYNIYIYYIKSVYTYNILNTSVQYYIMSIIIKCDIIITMHMFWDRPMHLLVYTKL